MTNPPLHIPLGDRARLVYGDSLSKGSHSHGLRRVGQRIRHEVDLEDGTTVAIDLSRESARFLLESLERMLEQIS